MSEETPHASPQCLSACAYLGRVLCGLIHGIDRDEVLAPNWQTLLHLKELHALHPEIAEVAEGSFRRKQPPEIVGSGYVVKSREAALLRQHACCQTTLEEQAPLEGKKAPKTQGDCTISHRPKSTCSK